MRKEEFHDATESKRYRPDTLGFQMGVYIFGLFLLAVLLLIFLGHEQGEMGKLLEGALRTPRAPWSGQ